MTEVTVEIARSIDEVSPEEWDTLVDGQSFVSHRWLCVAEACLVDYHPRYVLVRRNGRLDAGAMCSVGHRFKHQTLQRRLGWALRLSPLMRCCAPLSLGPGILVAARTGAVDLLPAVLQGVRDLARNERALFLTYAQCSPDDVRWPALSAAGFHHYGQLSDMVLPIQWQSTEDYLDSLPGSHRRRIKKQERRAEREGLRVNRLDSPLDHARRLRELIVGVLGHHGTRDIYVSDLVERTQAICGTDLHVIGAWRGDDMIGCAVSLRDGDALIARWLGLDYAQSWGSSAYRMLILRTIELAIQLGVRSLLLGPTASDAKRAFGAVGNERLSALAVLAPIPPSLVGSVAQLVAGRAAIDPTYSSAAGPASRTLPD